MSEICVEKCAVKRDCSGFEIRLNLKLVDMPRFPETGGMTREEKFTSVVVYLSKVVEEMQGETNGYLPPIPARRPNSHTTTGVRISSAVPIQGLLHVAAEAIAPPEDRKEPENTDVRSESMAQPTGQLANG